MPTLNLLYKDAVEINEHITISIPTVGEIIDREDEYYNLITLLTAMPIDLMVQLDGMGIDFTEISEFDLFLIIFSGLQGMDTSLVFGDLDLSKFILSVNTQNGQPVLKDEENGIVIDRLVQNKIASVLRKIHHLEKNRRKPANQEAKEYMLKRAKTRIRRNRNRVRDSQLESLIIALVNAEQFKYDFEGTRELSIYKFNESVRQIINKVDYEHRMHGVYAGTIDVKKLSQDDLNWLSHK